MNTPIRLSDDELRLIQLFRALDSDVERHDLLERLGRTLLDARLPGRSVYDFMPQACGIEPSGSIGDPSSVAHVIHAALEATGTPATTLLGSSARDDADLVPQFAIAAQEAAQKQGGTFEHDESAVREYLEAWRWELVWAIRRQRFD
ncbi:MAG: hypothetical protein ABI859_18285 [Pseudomonadota bacterium]